MKTSHTLPSGARSKAKATAKNGSPEQQRSAGASTKASDCGHEDETKVANKGQAARGKVFGKSNSRARAKVNGRRPAAVAAATVGSAPAPLHPATNAEELVARIAALESRYRTDEAFNEADADSEPREDPIPPVIPGKAIAVLDLKGRSNLEMGSFTYAVGTAANSSPYAAGSIVSGADVLNAANKLTNAITAQRVAADEAKVKTQLVDQARIEAEAVLNGLKGEVQRISQGDAAVIESFGLPIKRARTPVGELPSPLGLVAGNGPNSGMFILTWAAVADARGYVVQCAEGDVPTNWENLKGVMVAKMTLSDLVPGKTYHFRVASFGGASGQSAWSPVVSRVCS